MTAGSLAASSNAYVGNSGTGTFNQSGGTNSIGSTLDLGNNVGDVGSYGLSGVGQISAAYENVGLSGTGTFNQSGGINTVANQLILGVNAGASGTYNLNGGLLVASSLGQGPGTAAFNFSGGTLSRGGGFTVGMPLTLASGGSAATFDTAGHAVVLASPLSGPGSLTLNDSLGTRVRGPCRFECLRRRDNGQQRHAAGRQRRRHGHAGLGGRQRQQLPGLQSQRQRPGRRQQHRRQRFRGATWARRDHASGKQFLYRPDQGPRRHAPGQRLAQPQQHDHRFRRRLGRQREARLARLSSTAAPSMSQAMPTAARSPSQA